MIKLYYSTGTCSTAVSIVLEEAHIPFEGVEVSWSRNLNVEELANVNSLGQVPVLVDEGRALTQTHAILAYLGDRSGLMPKAGTWERATASRWMAFAGGDLQKSYHALFAPQRLTNNEAVQAEIKAKGLENVKKLISYLDANLGTSDYLVGSQFTVADAHIFTIVGWARNGGIKFSDYPKLYAYMKRVYDRPAVQKVLKSEGLLDYVS
jgi:glutathione S-transferase